MAAPVQMAAMAAPVQMAPVQAAPVQMAPVQMAPIQMAPVQMAPAQMAPVQMAPVQMAPSQCSSSQAAPAAAPSFGCNSGGASGPASAPNQDLAARIVELLENNRRQAAPLGAPSAPGDSLDDRVADLEARVDRLEDAAEKLRSVLTVHNDEIIKLKNK
jgi:hypothetical protein